MYQKLRIISTLTAIGQASLCIYIINSLFNELILIRLPITNVNYLITIAEAAIIILAAQGIYMLLKSNNISSYFFLGGR